MLELDNTIIIDSDKQFRIRVTGYVRGLGVSQIIGTREYLEIIFIGGEFSVRVGYPQKLGVKWSNKEKVARGDSVVAKSNWQY